MWLNHNCSSLISFRVTLPLNQFHCFKSYSSTTPQEKKKNTKAHQVVSKVNHEVLFKRTMALKMKNGEKPVKINLN